MRIAFFVNDIATEYAGYTTTVLAHQAVGVALLGGARRPQVGALLAPPGERRLVVRRAGRPGIRRAGGGEDGESDHQRPACPEGNRAEVHGFAYLV